MERWCWHNMYYTLKNDKLCLTVDSLGAQMMRLQSADGVEYLWQGDPKYWSDRAPTLFPFIGRLTNDSYRYLGKVYPMHIHGFAASMEFEAVEQTEESLTLRLSSRAETLEQYPFAFLLQIVYTLRENTVDISYQVQNLSRHTMPFGIGGHPGFNVPLVRGEAFEDYVLQFSCPCQPDRVGFSPAVYLNGQDERYPLQQDQFLELRHGLFDEDAVILKNMAREVTLRSKVSGRGVCVSYPDMPYLGIWHWPKTDAPYVCIEPWSSLPSRQDVVEEFTCKSDLIQLPAGKEYATTWSITLI